MVYTQLSSLTQPICCVAARTDHQKSEIRLSTLLSSAGRAQDCNCSTSNRYLEARGSIPRGETLLLHFVVLLYLLWLICCAKFNFCGHREIRIFGGLVARFQHLRGKRPHCGRDIESWQAEKWYATPSRMVANSCELPVYGKAENPSTLLGEE